MRILIAEDERDLNRLLVRRLTAEGYVVDSVFDGQSAWNKISAAAYDAAVLDIMMPETDGLTVLRRMRETGIEIPVIMLTARDAIEDRVAGLDVGADDYLIKPFAMDELMARIYSIIRRCKGERCGVMQVGDLTLDPVRHQVQRGGQMIDLSGKEYSILACLMASGGSVVTREQLLAGAWSADYTGTSNVVDVYIRYLRSKIDDPFERKLLHTVRGIGYVLREQGNKVET